ncbi:MAG: FecR domain-containing protein, partial [Pseudomonadota bacterium]
VALVVGGVLAFRQFDTVTYQVTNGSIGPGGFVHPTAAGTTIVFSEGSEIALGEAARTRVDALTADGGHVVVESGVVQARIVPRKHARWVVDAGPYTIRVTGTVFKVKWSWTSEMLDLQLDHGSVVVTGPLAPAGVTLTTGMRLTANPRAGLAIGAGAASGPASLAAPGIRSRSGASAVDERGQDERGIDPSGDDGMNRGVDFVAPAESGLGLGERARSNNGRQKAAPAARLLAGPLAGPPGGWDRQLARGDVQAILNDADARGVDRVLRGASGRDLSALADAARYGHRPALARRALLSMRDRFPRSAEAREAAFFLGGLAEDAAGAGGSSAALRWYEQYLGDSAGGRYSAQALGRKMVITQKLKGIEAARVVAAIYLERFPAGPYASAARKLTSP